MNAVARHALAVCAGAVFSLFGGCVTAPQVVENPPPAPREFRAVWVASVANIDWPSQPGLPVEQQRDELIAILDQARAMRLNAVILQVRPAADALYASSLEPWSEYLTGEQGRAPQPYYDPLKVWIEEAHRRGLELHAWFNPYRARHHAAKSALAATHLAKTHPGSVKRYGELLWMDPGDAVASHRTMEVVREVVQNYDVDGIHIDDYFYPYPIPVPPPAGAPANPSASEAKATVDFPDEPSWQHYVTGGGQLSRAGWRRQNVNQLVERMYQVIHRTKPWVRFGISPFGLGRPDRRPPGIEGFSQYDKLYADVELWVENGWLDYLTPQLYWPITQKPQAFGVLLDYWAKQNTAKRHLWPGLFTSSLNDGPKTWTADEITRQIGLVRAHPAAGGHVHFSMVALLQDRRGISTQLQAGLYAQPALIPATPWLGVTAPAAPKLKRQRGSRVMIQAGPGEAAVNYAIWKRHGTQWRFSVQPAGETVIDLTADPTLGTVAAVVVSAVDRLGNEGPRATLRFDSGRKP